MEVNNIFFVSFLHFEAHGFCMDILFYDFCTNPKKNVILEIFDYVFNQSTTPYMLIIFFSIYSFDMFIPNFDTL
jgi:hypothetical protein